MDSGGIEYSKLMAREIRYFRRSKMPTNLNGELTAAVFQRKLANRSIPGIFRFGEFDFVSGINTFVVGWYQRVRILFGMN